MSSKPSSKLLVQRDDRPAPDKVLSNIGQFRKESLRGVLAFFPAGPKRDLFLVCFATGRMPKAETRYSGTVAAAVLSAATMSA
jgi:hypothetical protein